MRLRTPISHITDVSWLHRQAPLLLAVVGIALTVAFCLGIQGRINDGYLDGLSSSYRDAEQVGVAMHSLVRARFRSTNQAAQALESLPAGGEVTARKLFEGNFGLGTSSSGADWADEAGTIRFSSDSHQIGRSVPKSWVTQAATATADSVLIDQEDEPLVPAQVLIARKAAIGDRKGYVILYFPADHFTVGTAKLLAGRHGYVSLVTNRGGVIVSATDQGLHTDRGSFARSHSFYSPDQPPYREESGQEFLAAKVTPPGANFSIITGLNYGESLKAWDDRRLKTIHMSIAMLGVVLVMLLGSAFVLFRSVGTERQLRRLVALDPLTNLPNRRTFTELLEKEVAVATTTGTPLGLMFIDLDNFKYVNDSLGHEVGDMLLQQVALRLSSSVRASDVVCRIGGDEFTVVLPNLGSMEDAEAIASRILESLGKPLRVGENSLSTSASVGIAVCPWDASSLTHLVRCADMAVYRAKAQGKSCAARYSPDLLHAAQSRNQLVQELRTALAGDDQLFLVYQPKIQLESGEVSGFEALIRWQHPQRGLVMPSDFIAAAEESELIIKLGDYVVNQAVAQIRAWCDQGYGWRKVAVNVSARQLRGGHVASTIQDALLRHGVPGQYLQIELTETMLATEEDFAAKTLARLQMLGVAIAVDDFGTGYSSLQSLQQLDVDCIKVDRSFVAGIGVNKDSMEIVRTVVNLAHNLELRVVAEGIETLDQYKYLMELGCDEGQGYFFARPLVASEAIQYSTTVALFTPLAA